LYLLFPVFEGLNMKLHYHVRHELYGDWAMQKAMEVMNSKNLTEQQIADLFHRKGEKTSKFLLFLVIPFMGAVSWLLAFRKRKLYFDNFIFSIEVSSFFILWGFLLLPLLLVIAKLIGLSILSSEAETGLTILIVSLIFVVLASKRFFKFSWWYSILYSILFVVILSFFIQYIYKFILFIVAINLI